MFAMFDGVSPCPAGLGVPGATPGETAIPTPKAQRAFKVATLVVGAGALYLAAQAATGWAGYYVVVSAPELSAADAKNDDDELDEEAEAKAKADKKRKKVYTWHREPPKFALNPFCPSCLPPDTEEEPVVVQPVLPGVDTDDFPGAVASKLPLTLLATMEATAPGISVATIRSTGTDASFTGLYEEGDQVVEDVELQSVRNGIVYLLVEDHIEFLQIGVVPEPPKTPTARPTPKDDKSKSKKKKWEIEGADDAIKCSSNNVCTVERAFMEKLLANPTQLMTQGKAMPYDSRGLKGFRLSRVRTGTIPKMLGLRTGDVITEVNGQPLGSIDGAMKLYTKLRRASHLQFEVIRNKGGERTPITVQIDIV